MEWLEKQLKLSLFVRTTRQIHLTEAGSTFLPQALALLSRFDTMISETQYGAEHPVGMLHITAPLSVGSSILMPHIEAFLALHKDVKIQLDVQNFGENPDLDHDLVFCRKKEDFNSAAHRGVKLKTYQMGIFAAPSYLKRHKPITNLKELEAHNMIIPGAQQKIGVLEMDNGEEVSLANHNFVSDNLDALLYAAIRGMGIIFATQAYIDKEVKSGLLVRVLPEIKSTDRELWGFYPRTEHMPLKSRLFLDFIKQRL
ncbi:MAG: DNA-binding transcriptional LysR family regulator [Phenylobacterium sp.]